MRSGAGFSRVRLRCPVQDGQDSRRLGGKSQPSRGWISNPSPVTCPPRMSENTVPDRNGGAKQRELDSYAFFGECGLFIDSKKLHLVVSNGNYPVAATMPLEMELWPGAVISRVRLRCPVQDGQDSRRLGGGHGCPPRMSESTAPGHNGGASSWIVTSNDE